MSGATEILTVDQDVLFEQAARILRRPDPEYCVVDLHGRCDQPATIVTLISQYLAGLPKIWPNVSAALSKTASS